MKTPVFQAKESSVQKPKKASGEPTKNSRKTTASRSSRSTGQVQSSVGCLFSAMGGFALAFQTCGARVAWANEKDGFASQTFRFNFPTVRHIQSPIEELSVKADALEPVDVLTAGFPCQPFSVAGERLGFNDHRGLVFFEIMRIVQEFGPNRPKILLLENVANFKSHDEGRTFRRVQSEIQKAGYWFGESNAKVLNTSTHTNIPQNRSRVFMVALSSDEFVANTFHFPEPMSAEKRRPISEFLDLTKKQEPCYYIEESSQYHSLFKEAIGKHGKHKIYQLRRTYVRDNKSGLCFTLTASMGLGGHNEPVVKDRWGIRKLTPAECARLQGYSDDLFAFPPDMPRREAYKQVGNTVTVPLVTRIAKNCLDCLDPISK
jgi:DNA (cytosine-5)-methyltransferase 1